jgi:phage N-6-adenine-methyltransferase
VSELAQETPTATDKPEWWTSDDWSTPLDVFQRIAARYGPFDLDPCCREATAKAAKYFTKVENGLSQPWHGRVFVNPPYSDPEPWIVKAVKEVEYGCTERVVMLLPAAIDTGWYHRFVIPNADVVPVRGRIRFIGWQGTPIGSPKAGNIIAIFPKRAVETFHAKAEAR